MRTNRSYSFLFMLSLGLVFAAQGQDSVADNMLLYQRSVGGWPKHFNDVKVDYTKALSSAEKAGVVDDLYPNDATIDNNATTKEIRYLAKVYKRGWTYAENRSFYANTGTAAIWHDGSTNPAYKTVLKNCTFDGHAGFRLGRYHKDAQFFLVGCRFSKNMANEDIYRVAASNNKLQWGRRVYYQDCHRQGEDYAWFKNNLATATGSPSAQQINAQWVFQNKWYPEKNL